jgi:hypothetical protein
VIYTYSVLTSKKIRILVLFGIEAVLTSKAPELSLRAKEKAPVVLLNKEGYTDNPVIEELDILAKDKAPCLPSGPTIDYPKYVCLE